MPAKPTTARAPAQGLEKYRLTRLVSPFDSAEVVGWHVNDVDKGNGKTFGKGEMTFETRDAAFKMQSLLNAHSELVAALKMARARLLAFSTNPTIWAGLRNELDTEVRQIQAALKKAGGGS